MNSPVANGHNSVLLIGGRDAGKSNFLFRLWIAIDHGSCTLIKDGLPSDIEYLRAGAERLLEGEFAERTAPEVRERVIVPVRCADTALNLGGTLILPDVPGEQVLTIYRTRQWSRDWEELISPRCACLLFIRAGSDEIVAPLDWAACFEKYGAALEAHDESQAQMAPLSIDDRREEGINSIEPPSQVVLTEWLQFLRLAFTATAGGTFRPRIGIVISAWDAVPAEQQAAGPIPYLKENFPMLHQFVQANDAGFDFHEFGLSVVAGDLTNDEEFKAEYLSGKPQDFGFVVHSLFGRIEKSPDITLPIAWALRLLPHER